jgi:hypothetical protein
MDSTRQPRAHFIGHSRQQGAPICGWRLKAGLSVDREVKPVLQDPQHAHFPPVAQSRLSEPVRLDAVTRT